MLETQTQIVSMLQVLKAVDPNFLSCALPVLLNPKLIRVQIRLVQQELFFLLE